MSDPAYDQNQSSRPGLTLRSLAVALAGLVAVGALIQIAVGVIGFHLNVAAEALALVSLLVFALILIAVGVVHRWCGQRPLSRPELLCIAYMLLMAAPLMNHSFWTPIISLVSPHAVAGQWHAYDTLPRALRPQGRDCLVGMLERPDAWQVEGGRIATGHGAYAVDRQGPLLRLEADGPARLRLPLPIGVDGVLPDGFFVFSARFRVVDVTPQTIWTVSVQTDHAEDLALELVRQRGPTAVSAISPQGFVRDGNWAFRMPAGAEDHVVLEIALQGPGTLVLADAELADITAFIRTRYGAQEISRADYEALPPERRAGLLVRPERMWSLSGLWYLISGRVLWGHWWGPLLWWTAFLSFLLGGSYAIAVIMRRQWVDRERYPLPLAMPMMDVIGHPEADVRRPWPALCYSGAFWTGLVVTTLFCLSKLMAHYHPGFPSLGLSVSVRSYLADPMWGRTWAGVSWTILPMGLAIGLLMDVQVLLSMVVGFFLFRLQYLFGYQTGLDADRQYPYIPQQSLGAWFGYGLAVLYMARRAIVRTLVAAWRGESATASPAASGEPEGYRSAWVTLVICTAGLCVWSMLLGSSLLGSLHLVVLGVLTTVVFMKLRAECGVPGIQWFGGKILLVVPVIGGLTVIGPAAFSLNAELGRIIAGFSILVVAGLQFEFLELARRYRVRRSHVAMTIALAVLGGVFIGGWFLLSGSYAMGTENMRHSTLFGPYRTAAVQVQMAASQATAEMVSEHPTAGVSASGVAFAGAGLVSMLLVWLRQLGSGFWFHPIGFLLGCSSLMAQAWGSLTLAWLIRALVLRLGGASTVRDRLRPFAVGMIVGIVLAYGVVYVVNLIVWSQAPGASHFTPSFSPG